RLHGRRPPSAALVVHDHAPRLGQLIPDGGAQEIAVVEPRSSVHDQQRSASGVAARVHEELPGGAVDEPAGSVRSCRGEHEERERDRECPVERRAHAVSLNEVREPSHNRRLARSGPRVELVLAEDEWVVDRRRLPVGGRREAPAPDELKQTTAQRHRTERRALEARGAHGPVARDHDADRAAAGELRILERRTLVAALQLSTVGGHDLSDLLRVERAMTDPERRRDRGGVHQQAAKEGLLGLGAWRLRCAFRLRRVQGGGAKQRDGEQGHEPHRPPSPSTGSEVILAHGEAAGTRAQTTGALREACSGRSPRLRSMGVYRAAFTSTERRATRRASARTSGVSGAGFPRRRSISNPGCAARARPNIGSKSTTSTLDGGSPRSTSPESPCRTWISDRSRRNDASARTASGRLDSTPTTEPPCPTSLAATRASWANPSVASRTRSPDVSSPTRWSGSSARLLAISLSRSAASPGPPET